MTGVIGGTLAHWILRRYKWADMTGDFYRGKSNLEMTHGSGVWSALTGKTVLDFGCGAGDVAGNGGSA